MAVRLDIKVKSKIVWWSLWGCSKSKEDHLVWNCWLELQMEEEFQTSKLCHLQVAPLPDIAGNFQQSKWVETVF